MGRPDPVPVSRRLRHTTKVSTYGGNLECYSRKASGATLGTLSAGKWWFVFFFSTTVPQRHFLLATSLSMFSTSRRKALTPSIGDDSTYTYVHWQLVYVLLFQYAKLNIKRDRHRAPKYIAMPANPLAAAKSLSVVVVSPDVTH